MLVVNFYKCKVKVQNLILGKLVSQYFNPTEKSTLNKGARTHLGY